RPRFFAVHIGGAPLESGHHFESQMIQRIQNVFGRTLRQFRQLKISSFSQKEPAGKGNGRGGRLEDVLVGPQSYCVDRFGAQTAFERGQRETSAGSRSRAIDTYAAREGEARRGRRRLSQSADETNPRTDAPGQS